MKWVARAESWSLTLFSKSFVRVEDEAAPDAEVEERLLHFGVLRCARTRIRVVCYRGGFTTM